MPCAKTHSSNIWANIFENPPAKGSKIPQYKVSFCKSYTNDKQEPKVLKSFRKNDLPHLLMAVGDAFDIMRDLEQAAYKDSTDESDAAQNEPEDEE